MGLTFLPRPPPNRPRKRSRAVADIDGEHSCMQKKKRRLRLFLITSRLSPQFSHPATNIVDRGSSKIAVWAKQRALGRNLLRKAAILNRIRRQAISAREVEDGQGRVLVEQEREQEQFELARLEFEHGSVDTYTRPVHSQTPSVPPSAAIRTGGHFVVSGSPSSSPSSSRSPSPTPTSPPLRGIPDDDAAEYRSPNEAYALSPPRAQLPRRDYLPLPPSPLGLSNYEAFDVDEDTPDPYARFDDEEEDQAPSYPFADDEIDEDTFSLSATATVPPMTTQPVTTQVLPAPQIAYADLNALGPEEAVFGDYDQVDEGADAVWPSTFAQEAVPATTRSSTSSPDFPTIFATAASPPPPPPPPPSSKRNDSFAMSPNFRPQKPKKSVSPNFAPSTMSSSGSIFSTTSASPSSLSSSSASTTPNFAPSTLSISSASASTSTSPNFAPSLSSAPVLNLTSPRVFPASTATRASISPNFAPSVSVPGSVSVSPNFAPTVVATSPNFAAVDEADAPAMHRRSHSHSNDARPGMPGAGGSGSALTRRTSDIEQEDMERRRRGQRGIGFMRFGE
ncbi:hypothetical protein N0V83_010385 [Neocucurbitaria cava]|uniref:Uncharacterized protein n=1 Tax=Neocucurbitaria cava TaxID=798079 RepID=A0A9W9CHB1_9PLEO|nr:hypothetical protein N0V83_010385 [Neocucurbitaria cava]